MVTEYPAAALHATLRSKLVHTCSPSMPIQSLLSVSTWFLGSPFSNRYTQCCLILMTWSWCSLTTEMRTLEGVRISPVWHSIHISHTLHPTTGGYYFASVVAPIWPCFARTEWSPPYKRVWPHNTPEAKYITSSCAPIQIPTNVEERIRKVVHQDAETRYHQAQHLTLLIPSFASEGTRWHMGFCVDY